MDQQVKVSGYRVDMAEIETALRACRSIAVADAAVVAVESPAGAQLVANVVLAAPARAANPAPDEVTAKMKAELRDVLPAYAVPRQVRVRDALPLNAHGKVDRHWLSTATRP